MRSEHSANVALQPVPLAQRLQAAGWQVGKHALTPGPARVLQAQTSRGFFARFFVR